MAPQVNWSKVKTEINKLTDLDRVKEELRRIAQEIRKFDINSHLSPTARERLKTVETKYHEISSSLNRTQRQIDREFNRVLRFIQDNRSKAKQGLAVVKQAAVEQRRRLKKVSTDLKSRMLKATNKKRKTSRKKSSKTATA